MLTETSLTNGLTGTSQRVPSSNIFARLFSTTFVAARLANLTERRFMRTEKFCSNLCNNDKRGGVR
jgi:hypothetical protein